MLYFLVSHNPMTLLMNCYRNVMMYGTMPEWGSLAVLLLISFVLIMMGNWVFDKLQKGFAEEL